MIRHMVMFVLGSTILGCSEQPDPETTHAAEILKADSATATPVLVSDSAKSVFAAAPDRETICATIDNSYKCAQAIERRWLDSGKPMITRDSTVLTIRLQNGALVQLTDSAENNPKTTWHSYVNFLPSIGYHVIELQYWEGSAYLLLSAATVNSTTAYGPPVVSPDRSHLIAVAEQLESWYGPTGIQIWRVIDGGLDLEWDHRTVEYGAWTDAAWGPRDPQWVTESRVRVKRVTIDRRGTVSDAGIVTLVHGSGGWWIDDGVGITDVRMSVSADKRWPQDQLVNQLQLLPLVEIAIIPTCRTATPVVTIDSIGPLSMDLTVSELLEVCDNAIFGWYHVGEADGKPGVAVRLGDVAVSVILEDTLPTSHVVHMETSSRAARTPEGFGPGSTFRALLTAYGEPTMLSYSYTDAVIQLAFKSRPAMRWILGLGATADTILDSIQDPVDTNLVARDSRATTLVLWRDMK